MDKKKIIIWIIICLVLFFIPAIFMKQFFNLDNMVIIPTINFGNITMPGLLAGGISFWGFILIIYGIIIAVRDGYKWIVSKKRRQPELSFSMVLKTFVLDKLDLDF